ncbi:hypothetical protein [Streptomyces sp. 8L]|uniref:hypothetical protein n=1 Tax=Streptomyces sp. 8L TaxID=2877242 RepID=UPI001CD6D08B|nr:hypothetical protein [Streptomyces sp. 8L]MCA1222984.1 hypothetical protein [Streptomyces sp. 8L]
MRTRPADQPVRPRHSPAPRPPRSRRTPVLTRIVALTTDRLRSDADHTYLTISRHPVVLPPKPARLIDELLDAEPDMPGEPAAETMQ